MISKKGGNIDALFSAGLDVKMDCREIRDELSDYYHRKLPKDKNSEIAAHLYQCRDCRKELAFLIQTEKLFQEQLVCQSPPAEVIKYAFDKLPRVQKDSTYAAVSKLIRDFYDVCRLSGQLTKLSFQIL